MIESFGNLWSFNETKCVTTNGVLNKNGELVMGAGVALQASARFPELPKILGGFVSKYGNRVFFVRQFNLISFPTKYGWKDKSDIELIKKSSVECVELANKFNLKKVIMPQPGCGNGHLIWNEVKRNIENILDDRFVVVSNNWIN